jgi:ATP-dependent 26S proteasome regulatory subunit
MDKQLSSIQLCPSQQKALDGLRSGVGIGPVMKFWGGAGSGKTTVLREFHRESGGGFLNMRHFVEASTEQHPMAMEETFYRVVLVALKANETVIVDDLHLLASVVSGCHFYPRSGFLEMPVKALCTYAADAGKTLIFSTDKHLPEAANERCYPFGINRFTAADYAALAKNWLPESVVDSLDFAKVFRFASRLNAHQLKAACNWLAPRSDLDTNRFIEYLRSQRLASNIDLGEVQEVDLSELKGIDDVLRSLEINIALPLENDRLANEFQLRPKRGVLLYGPPGTGKTTVGRALAHRLKSKFFLIDGTFIAGTRNFYENVHRVFESAKENAPSIIFIDDADAIFETGEERGLYRYLLTMLDGLESESAGRVCVMLTAMTVAHLPPALVRSGRVELWLEMKLPDAAARESILSGHLRTLPPELRDVDLPGLSGASEGFTGADLKRTVEDGKSLFAYDIAKAVSLRSPTDYFLTAVENVRQNKERYNVAAAQAAQHALTKRLGGLGGMESMVFSHIVQDVED